MAKKKYKNTIRHAYVSGDPDLAPILLLHGTGGDETDLLEIAEFLAPENPKISIRGRVSENGMNRYFERYEEGEFNLESLHAETDWLVDAVHELAKRYELHEEAMIMMGFSNGANIGAHAMMAREDTPWKTALLFHAMSVERLEEIQDLTDTRVFASFGEFDPIISETNFDMLTEDLRKGGTLLSTFAIKTSHTMSQPEMQAAKLWLDANDLLDVDDEPEWPASMMYGEDEHDHHHHDEHDHDHHHEEDDHDWHYPDGQPAEYEDEVAKLPED
ncbi:alpha/beta hydrolase [Weissella cibaria]|uniref:alpha/beta hydrolase n=1 Tax=Weissella cibaria TaxID=137591 RepID=UPI003B510418